MRFQGSDDVSPKEGRPEHLFESSMPGILQPEEILGLVPFAEVKVKIEEEVIHLPVSLCAPRFDNA